MSVESEGAVSVSGLIGVGLQARSNRSRQTFIVNGRTIRSPLLTQALEDGCCERVTVGHYPVCVLNVQMPVAMVDVNVHPNKLEVRFSDENLIYQSVKGAIEDSFQADALKSAPRMTLVREDAPAVQGTVSVIVPRRRKGGGGQGSNLSAQPASQDAREPDVHVIEW